MENQRISFSALNFIFFFFFFGADAAKITVKSNCKSTIWPAVLTVGTQPQLSTTGFELAPGASRWFNVPAPWSGRVWARTQCTDRAGNFTCLTGDCGSGEIACNGARGIPPATLAEFSIAVNGGQDFYDLSLVDGFNVPASLAVSAGDCKSPGCAANVNAVCPAEMQVKAATGEVIGCTSACSAFNQPQYCCLGEFDGPEKCKPTAYSRIFKAQCPDAYSYPYDDKTSMFSCGNQPDYILTFCEGEDLGLSFCRGPIQLELYKVKTTLF